MAIKTFAQAEAAIARLRPNTVSASVQTPERMAALMEFLGNPQDAYKVVHVAGTSGKTSTAYYVAALLGAAGKKTGLTISPHAYTLNERLQFNLRPLSEAQFCARFDDFLKRIAPSGITPTYFEAMIALAFWEFAQAAVEYAVVEVGIGGLADSTNVVTRADKVCVIADIGFGHMSVLGNTLSEIAAQKAGIIQLHNAVFFHRQADEIMAAFTARARQKQADMHVVTSERSFDFLPLFQQRNFTLAEAAAEFVLERDGEPPLPDAARERAARITIPARMELHARAGKTIVLDGAHNAQKVRALVKALEAQFPGRRPVILLALLRQKAEIMQRLIRELGPLRPHIVITGFPPDATGHFGSADPHKVLATVQAAGLTGEVLASPHQALAACFDRPEDLIVATGSFYLLGPIRQALEQRR